MTDSVSVLFKLLKIALNRETYYLLSDSIDWRAVIDLSYKQGVTAIAMDGLQLIYESTSKYELELDKPEFENLKYEWYGLCVAIEQDYSSNLEAVTSLARFYKTQEIPMMLLKGFGLSLNYPVPNHRPSGDIDIYLWNHWNLADQMVERQLNISVDNSHHHHSVFRFMDCSVENHYDFVNVHSHVSNKKIEEFFKNLAGDINKAVKYKFSDGLEIYFPSPDLNALFIIRHCACHFASEEMNLRQLLDWVLFVDNHHQEVDWNQFWIQTVKMGMINFVLCINAIAVEQLGFDAEIFHTPQKYENFAAIEHSLVCRVLNDILHPEFDKDNGKGTIKYVLSRLKRWWYNRWKHKIVYSDSLASTFFVQIMSHLMKPATIKGV